MRLRNVLIVHSIWGCKTTAYVKKVLEEVSIRHTVIHRSRLNKKFFAGRDLVLVVGGDGTVLRTGHFTVDKTPLLGVNCDVTQNEGFFMRANRNNFLRKLKLLLADKEKLLSLTRLEVTLNKKKLPDVALNDVFLGDRRAHHTSRYWLGREYQKSSGVIVAAPAGTHAWYKSAGGKPLPLTSKKFAYIVREPYQGRLISFRNTRGVLKPSQRVILTSDIYDGIVVVDSVSPEYKFCCGDRVVVRRSKKDLNLVSF